MSLIVINIYFKICRSNVHQKSLIK